MRRSGGAPALPRARERRWAASLISCTKKAHACKDFALKRKCKLLAILTFLHVEVLDDGVEAALGQLGLLAEVKRLPLELAATAEVVEVAVCCLSMHVRPGRDGRSIAGQASRGWLGGNVLHRAWARRGSLAASVPPMAAMHICSEGGHVLREGLLEDGADGLRIRSRWW
eukprot:jgi/Mesvir1/13836/Mv15985-RA.1